MGNNTREAHSWASRMDTDITEGAGPRTRTRTRTRTKTKRRAESEIAATDRKDLNSEFGGEADVLEGVHGCFRHRFGTEFFGDGSPASLAESAGAGWIEKKFFNPAGESLDI